jgi:hypothetical protein
MDRLARFLLPVLLLGTLAVPAQAADRSIQLVGPVGVVKPGSTFSVFVNMTVVSQAINATQVTVRFPADRLQITSISREQSAMELWPEAPTWDNAAGTAHAEGGLPHGLYAIDARFVTLVFTALEPGPATVVLDTVDSAAFLNDGLGTRVSFPPVSVTVDIASEFTATVLSAPSTRPQPGKWTTERTVVLDWEVVASGQYSYAFSADGRTPDDIPEEKRGPLTFPNLEDGRYAFTIKYRPPSSPWSPITELAFLIDATPPEPFVLTHPDPKTVSDQEVLAWSAVDRTSGIDHATLAVNGRLIGSVESPLRLQPAWRGRTLTVTVFDQSGNSRSASWYDPSAPRASMPWDRWGLLGGALVAVAASTFLLLHRKRR